VTAAPELRAALEAVLLVVDEPADAALLAAAVGHPAEEVAGMLGQLAAEYSAEGRGFELREVAGGWRLYTRADCAPYVERFLGEDAPARLTTAALETLAIVAYRQPVTRGRIRAVRGVNVDSVLRTLVNRGLIEEAGTDPGSGAVLFHTTAYFLDRLGLASLDQLPELAPLVPAVDGDTDG